MPTDKGANAGLKVASLVAGMVAGADRIDDMGCCGTAGCDVCSRGVCAFDMGSFLRAFTFGHVRQLDAVASRFLTGLAVRAAATGLVGAGGQAAGGSLVDIDDTIMQVHGYAKQGRDTATPGSAA